MRDTRSEFYETDRNFLIPVFKKESNERKITIDSLGINNRIKTYLHTLWKNRPLLRYVYTMLMMEILCRITKLRFHRRSYFHGLSFPILLCTNSTKKSKRTVSAKNTLTGDYRINKALNILYERRLGWQKARLDFDGIWKSLKYKYVALRSVISVVLVKTCVIVSL